MEEIISNNITFDAAAILIAFSISCVFLFSNLLYNSPRKSKFPPGPPALPIIGHLHYMVSKYPPDTLDALSKKYGSLMGLRFGKETVVIVSDEKLAKEVLSGKGRVYADKPKSYLLGEILTESYGDLAMSMYGDRWRKVRKAAHAILTPKALEEMDDPINYESYCLLGPMYQAALEKKPINVRDLCSRYSLNIIFAKSFGRRLGSVESPEYLEVSRTIHRIFEVAPFGSLADFMPFLRIVPNQVVREMKELKVKIDDILMREINRLETEVEMERQKGVAQQFGSCFAKDLLYRMDEEGLTKKDIKLLMLDMLLAGLDTTATTLNWMIAIMANNPSVQDRLFEEVDNLLNKTRLPNPTDLPFLPLVRASIKETLRFRPVIPLVPRASIEDDVLDGYVIPKGTQMLINVKSVTQSSYKDQADFEAFNPDRFLHEKISESATNIYTFGGGRRVCVGLHLAHKELFTAASKLFYAFKFESADDKPIKLDEVFGISVCPHPYKVRIIPRFHQLGQLFIEAGVDDKDFTN